MEGGEPVADNPFFFGRTVTGPAFIDREQETEQIASSLERGQSVILFSPRRYGKTSLIRQVTDRLQRRGLLAFYLDLYRVTTLERFGQYYAQAVLSIIASPADRLFSLVRSLVPSLRPKLTYSEPNMPSIELELGLENLRRQSTLAELFNLIEQYCRKRKKRACLVFDEFQEITVFDSDHLLEREMRAAFQHHERVSYAFLGSKTHLMHELFKDKKRPFYNFGTHFELGAIEDRHWQPFIRECFDRSGYTLPQDQYPRITALTRGHPYYTQMLCSEIWEQAVHQSSPPSDPVIAALESILGRENHAFAEIWDTLSPAERRVVMVLAETGRASVFSADFLAAHRLGAASSLQRTVKKLMLRGIVDRATGGYTLADPVFKQWLVRGNGEQR